MPVFPSTAAEAGKEEFSSDDAVAVLPCESRVAVAAASRRCDGPAACAPHPLATSASASITTPAAPSRHRRQLRTHGQLGHGQLGYCQRRAASGHGQLTHG